MNEQQLREMLGRMLGLKAGQAGGVPSAQSVYGQGGLFEVAGVDRQVLTAFSLPSSSLANILPSTTSMFFNERVGLITGVGEGTGDEPDGTCDDLPGTGFTYGCFITFPFGRFGRSSSVLDLATIGQVQNRGIYTDLQVVGGMNIQHPFVPSGAGAGTQPQQILANDYRLSLFELAVEMLRKFGRLIYTGNPANNSPGKGYMEFKGLDMLVNTNYADADNPAVHCAALDSDVRTFNANIATDPGVFVRTLTNMVRNIEKRAEDTGLSPVELVLTMRWSAFQEITEYWPCAYATYRCQFAGGADDARLMVDVAYQEQMRQQMRDGRYLLIDGKKYRVQIDDFIIETQPTNGTFQSSVYVLPLTARGVRVLTMEHFNFDGPGAAGEVIRARQLGGWYRVTDGGRFLVWEKVPQNTCIQMSAITLPRLKLLTPHLAGRLDGVRYTPLMHEVSPWPDEPNYRSGGTAFR